MKTCRFCKTASVQVLFYPTRTANTRRLEEYTCTNCGFGSHGKIVRCRHCGIYYVDEKISQHQISTYYEVAQDPLYFAEQKAREITFGNYLKKLEKIFPKKGKLLDIGTNTGLFVKLAKDREWQAVGLEPNKWAVEYAKKNYGVTIVAKPFLGHVFPKASFDIVTMWDVIEHFTDPISGMKKVLYYLKPGGVFAFSTVDPESQLARLMGTRWSWYMEMHKVFFSRSAARYYLTRTGFKHIEFYPHFRSLSLGYLASRLTAVNAKMSMTAQKLARLLGISHKIVPYYANDLYDCYAFN